MIRNVVLGRLRPDADPAVLDEALRGIVDLHPDGLVQVHVGRAPGSARATGTTPSPPTSSTPRPTGATTADAEHDRLRRELFAPVSAEIARLQFEVPDRP